MSEAPTASRGAIGFIFVTLGLDALATGLVVPVLPKLVLSLGAAGVAGAAMTVGVLATAFAVAQFIAAPMLAALSDRHGRRPVLLISGAALGLDYLVMALAPTLPWLFAGRLISGAAAGSAPAAYAWLADTAPPDKRAQGFGLAFAAQAAGAALGPAIGGLAAAVDLRAPFWIAAGLSLANALYGRFVLPESLPPGQRAAIDIAHLNPIGPLTWLLRAYPRLAVMVAGAALLSLASQGVNNVAAVYVMGRYSWAPAQIGLVLTLFGVLSLAAQATLVTSTAKAFGGERGAMTVALIATVAGLALAGWATSGVVFTLALPLLALGALSGPMMAGIFSNAVDPAEQGRLQGAWAAVNSAVGLLAPALFTFVFAHTVSGSALTAPGAAFYLAAIMVTLAAALLYRGSRPRTA